MIGGVSTMHSVIVPLVVVLGIGLIYATSPGKKRPAEDQPEPDPPAYSEEVPKQPTHPQVVVTPRNVSPSPTPPPRLNNLLPGMSSRLVAVNEPRQNNPVGLLRLSVLSVWWLTPTIIRFFRILEARPSG